MADVHDGVVSGHVADSQEFGADVGTKAGTEVWRIENKRAVKWPEEKHGQFCEGDAYIVLHTIVPRQKYDLFFWLGKESSVDERGFAAYKTVDLDQHLKDVPVQYRECQGNESSRFVDLWKKGKGLKILSGGVESAFTHVHAGEGVELKPRLLRVKGRRSVRVDEVPKERASLNEGDSFIMILHEGIYLWLGKASNRYETIKAGETAAQIHSEMEGHVPLIRVKESPKEAGPFWKELGGEGPVAPGKDDDQEFEKLATSAMRFFALDAASQWQAQEAKFPLKREVLKSNGIYLLYAGNKETGIFFWVGKEAPVEQKRGLMGGVGPFLDSHKLDSFTRAERMDEGSESTLFKSFFMAPFDPKIPLVFGEVQQGHIAHMRASKVDVKQTIRARSSVLEAQRESHATDHGGTVKAWRIVNFDKVEVPKEQLGQFYDGDCYVIQHVWEEAKSKRRHALIYFWQGEDASVDETGSSALVAKQMDDEVFNGQATQIRTVMGKEDESFLILFKGKMIVHHGGVESGFKHHGEAAPHVQAEPPKQRLYHIRGTGPENARAIQVECKATMLHSNDAFVLVHENGVYVWSGKGATSQEEQIAAGVAATLRPGAEPQAVGEGSESDDFWQLLGGKQPYASDPAMMDPLYDPRLFQISNASGAMSFEEIFYFTQEDLINEDVMLLDTVNHVYIWVGGDSNPDERKTAPKIAEEYIQEVSKLDGRDPKGATILVKAGFEPPIFTCHFLHWDSSKSAHLQEEEEKREAEKVHQVELKQRAHPSGGRDSIIMRTSDPDVIRAQLKAEAAARGDAPASASAGLSGYADPKEKTFDLAELTGGRPEEVDPAHKEQYLSDAQFEETFNMTKDEFNKLQKWKQQGMKRKSLLF